MTRLTSRFKPLVPAVLTAVLYTLCFPKFNLGFLAWIAFVPLLRTIAFTGIPRAAGLSFLSGFVANIATLYWIYPTCRAADVDVAVSALALLSLSAYMALYWAAFGASAAWMDRLPGGARPILLAGAWAALEWTRGRLFTGFPWLLFAYSQWKSPALISTAEFGGPYAVSFWLMLANAGAAMWTRDLSEKRWNWPARLVPTACAVLVFIGGTIYLAKRPLSAAGPAMSVAIAQGNIDQYRKWDETYEADIRRVYSELSHEAAVSPTDLIIWPETAVPGWVPNEITYVHWLQDIARHAGSYLLTGAATHQAAGDYNAAFLFSPQGDLVGEYRKRHLVPFGEFIPFQRILTRWVRVLNELGNFAGSNDWTVFETPKGRFSANICFESLFPELVAEFARRGAQITVNLTNDGWYMDTAGPEQHFIASVFRAVETRTWVLRAANTGISGFIEPTGRVAARTRLLERTLLRGAPAPMETATFYSRHGDVFAKACGVLTLGGMFIGLWRTFSVSTEWSSLRKKLPKRLAT